MDNTTPSATETQRDILPPAVKAGMRLTQLYRGTRDGTLIFQGIIVGGRLLLVINGKTEDLGPWEPIPATKPAPAP